MSAPETTGCPMPDDVCADCGYRCAEPPIEGKTLMPETTELEILVARAIHEVMQGQPAFVGPFDDEGHSVTLDGLFSLRDAAREAIAVVRQWDAGK